MKIAIGVQGRFHAFALGGALAAHGHDVTIFTNYPAWLCERFGLPERHVRSFEPHAALSRLARVLSTRQRPEWLERLEHESFGRWLAEEVTNERFDVLHSFSGVAEEAFEALRGGRTFRSLLRGSAHISMQARLLDDEEGRSERRLEKPGRWVVEREKREYALADQIIVLSRFAAGSFRHEGFDMGRVACVPLGVATASFSGTAAEREARTQRIRAGGPLRVLYAGSISFRKGLYDLAQVVGQLEGKGFEFRLVGEVAAEADGFVREAGLGRLVRPRVAEARLRHEYAWGDVFLLPSIEDGFAAVLSQAAAAGLVLIGTDHTGLPELLGAGAPGWIVGIRRPDSIIERLRWCEANRETLGSMTEASASTSSRTWSDVARELTATWIRREQGEMPLRFNSAVDREETPFGVDGNA